jgi:hypothetical protein
VWAQFTMSLSLNVCILNLDNQVVFNLDNLVVYPYRVYVRAHVSLHFLSFFLKKEREKIFQKKKEKGK